MIDASQAEGIAAQHLHQIENLTGERLLLVRRMGTPFGWVFFYDSADYVATGNPSAMLAGNAPFLVKVEEGEVHVFGTAHPIEAYLREYGQQDTKEGQGDASRRPVGASPRATRW